MFIRRKSSKPVISLRRDAELVLMRRAGRAVALALQKVGEAIRPGITTRELDGIAEQTIRGLGGVPTFLGYQLGTRVYPAAACISLNDEVVHGIPGARALREGDLVSIDLGATIEGWVGDAAFTFSVGQVSTQARELMQAGKDALAAGIAAARVGNRVRDIGKAVQHVAESHGYSVVRDLCGHGVGRRLHEAPQVPNYWEPTATALLQPGMTIAIEPMVNAGVADVIQLADGWTYVTADQQPSVHYEHTVLITQGDAEILTTLR